MSTGKQFNLKGCVPESWACIDCGINTAPGHLARKKMEQAFAADWSDAGIEQTYDEFTEIYIVKEQVWKAARMEPYGGCLCICCLEKRIGRTLTPKDFPRHHPLNKTTGTERLLKRRGMAANDWLLRSAKLWPQDAEAIKRPRGRP
jgi:hypothetical protein